VAFSKSKGYLKKQRVLSKSKVAPISTALQKARESPQKTRVPYEKLRGPFRRPSQFRGSSPWAPFGRAHKILFWEGRYAQVLEKIMARAFYNHSPCRRAMTAD